MGRFTAFLDSLPPALARRVVGSPEAMARLQRAAAQGPEAMAAEARRMAAGPSFDGIEAAPPRPADLGVGSDDWTAMARSADSVAPARLRQQANILPGGRRGPNPAGDLKRIAADNIESLRAASRQPTPNVAPAGLAAAAVGTGIMLAPKGMDLEESGNPADLQDEPVSSSAPFSEEVLGGATPEDLMRPIPSLQPKAPVAPPAAKPQATPPSPAPADYSLQARELINKLNAMRRAAGGEVPEAPAMMKEINRLVAMGNEQRRDPGYSHPQADPARDPYQQARNLIAQVNNMYRAGYRPGSPEVERVMAEVRRLQAEGDAIRNRRVG